MGEVRVQVELINATDEALVRRGLLAPHEVRKYSADALVDTGTVASVLPVHVVQQLGVITIGKVRAEYANGSEKTVDLTEPVGMAINGRRVTEEMLVLGSEVLVGQTVLERMDMLVDSANKLLIPNPAHPDQPVLKVK